MGHPIYGDQKYGQKTSKVGQQIALWAQSLTLGASNQKRTDTRGGKIAALNIPGIYGKSK